jgi:dihydroxy-acid dehydratase
VFNREEEAHQAILEGKVEPGSIIVIRYEGPRGSGMPEMHATAEALLLSSTLSNTALVTDGRFSGATRGPCIGHVSPEAARGGPIGLVEDGDLISIDIPQRSLSIVGRGETRMDAEKVQALLDERKKQYQAPSITHKRGLFQRYAQHAASAIKGAYLE